MNGKQLLSEHKQQIIELAKENGISNIRLFGSTARGEDRKDSDIDLLVDIAEDRTLFDLIRFKQEVEGLLGRKVDVMTEKAVHDSLKQSIMSEVVQL